jgi:Mrp family chromosome partitioning ATPase
MDAKPSGRLSRGIRRHWWLPIMAAVAGCAVGAVVLLAQPAQFDSNSAVLVLPVPAGAGDDLSRTSIAAINLDTEAQLVRSTETSRRAAELLGTSQAPTQLVNAVTVTPVAGSSVLEVHFIGGTAGDAQAGARAFAEAYLAARADAATTALKNQKTLLATNLTDIANQLADLDARIAVLPSTSAQLPSLRSTRATLAGQITTLTSRMSDLATTIVTPGQVIRDADLPATPQRGPAWLYLGVGLLAGLGAGLLTAALREQLRARVRDSHDIAELLGVPVLSELAHSDAQLHAAADAPSRDYHRLRNEVVAALATGDRVLLLTSASPGPASTVVAANLAAALARIGHDVVLVGANPPPIGAAPVLLSSLFDISDVPGLTDVLSGRTDLSTALQTPPREPRLRVVTPGGAASASRLLQSATARAVVTGLRTMARYILIDSPSAAIGADAQSLAGLADAAIVVAEAGHSRHDDVADAVAQLRLVGARVLGGVVLPRVEPVDGHPENVFFIDTTSHSWDNLTRDAFPPGSLQAQLRRDAAVPERPA